MGRSQWVFKLICSVLICTFLSPAGASQRSAQPWGLTCLLRERILGDKGDGRGPAESEASMICLRGAWQWQNPVAVCILQRNVGCLCNLRSAWCISQKPRGMRTKMLETVAVKRKTPCLTCQRRVGKGRRVLQPSNSPSGTTPVSPNLWPSDFTDLVLAISLHMSFLTQTS